MSIDDIRDKQTRTEDIDLEAIRKGVNLFEDEGEHKNNEDKKLYVKPLAVRSRRKTTIKIACTQCKKEFTISKSILVEGKHTCSRCIVSKGAR